MFTIPASVRIYVAAEPVDLRRGIDGLSALTRSVIGGNPMSGHVFVFVNRRRTAVKLLIWDRTGFLLIYKRLAGHGSFRLPVTPSPGSRSVELDAGDLALMLEGIDLRGARRQRRWTYRPHEGEPGRAESSPVRSYPRA
jgi:transposase